jgi:hypothetical protein
MKERNLRGRHGPQSLYSHSEGHQSPTLESHSHVNLPSSSILINPTGQPECIYSPGSRNTSGTPQGQVAQKVTTYLSQLISDDAGEVNIPLSNSHPHLGSPYQMDHFQSNRNGSFASHSSSGSFYPTPYVSFFLITSMKFGRCH